MPRYAIRYERDALADLTFLGRQAEVRVRRAVDRFLADQPVPAEGQEGQRKALDANPLVVAYRLRVGEYRIYYNVVATDVQIVRVGRKPRETVYLRGQPFDMRDYKESIMASPAPPKRSTTTTRTTRVATRRIAPLTPDSPDPDARADATNPALVAELAASRQRADAEGGALTADELDRRRPLTAEEIAEADAWLDQLEATEGEIAPDDAEHPLRGRAARAGRPRGRRPTDANGKVLLRLPLSVHQELIARAAAEQTSLNQLVLAYISRGLGQDAGPAR